MDQPDASMLDQPRFDYSQEVYTPLLWVMEGFTTYYDLILLRRSGLIDSSRALEMLGERIASYLQQPGRLVQSLEESSLTAWIKFYRQDENYVNSGISYYLKGSLVALLLDLSLRCRSDNERSLDDLMRLLWQRYGRPEVGFHPEQLLQAVRELGDEALAHELQAQVAGVADLPLSETLAAAGLQLTLERKADTPPAWLGVRLEEKSGALTVSAVLRDGPGEAAGLMAADRLIALDGYEARDDSFVRARLRERQPGERVRLHLFRYGQLLERQLVLGETPPDQARLRVTEEPTPLQRRILQEWLLWEGGEG